MKKLLIGLWVLSLVALSACSGDQNPLLLGKWDDGDKGVFEFFGDHRIVVYTQDPETKALTEDYRGKWSMLDDGRIRMELQPLGKNIQTLAYFRDDDNLIMEMKGRKFLLTRWKPN